MRITKAQNSLRILINALVIHLLESLISQPVSYKISIFDLVSVAEQVVLNHTQSENQKDTQVLSDSVKL